MFPSINITTNSPIYNNTAIPVIVNEYCKQSVSTRHIILAIIASTVLLVGIIGNTLTIAVIWYSHNLRSQITYYFVSSLAAADLCVSLMLTSLKVDKYTHNANFCHSRIICIFYQFFDIFFLTSSITHLFVISIDRFIAIKLPYFHTAKVTNTKVKIIIACIWGYATIWSLLNMFPWDPLAYVYKIRNGATLRECVSSNKYYVTVAGVVVYFVPTTIMTVLYGIILVIAQKQAKAIANLRPAHLKEQKRIHRKDMRALKTVLLVSLSYYICFSPTFIITFIFYWNREIIVNFYLAYPNPGEAFDVVFTISNDILPMVNSCLNPFIYFLSSSHFRIAFKDMIYKVLRKPRQGIIYPDETTLNTKQRTTTTNTFINDRTSVETNITVH